MWWAKACLFLRGQKLTPKAQFMVLLGYQAPFDRHDWAVDRCGKKIDYVIDFYSGKPHPKWAEALSFYLDTCTPVQSYRQRVHELGCSDSQGHSFDTVL
ncbi:hypothetical protein L873DRAFT_1881967 [Choiromyces venosus 120613-1]|uniref:Holocytochrome c-type synthase n=1 Tax=Choiromyces venosus 120613-1 TaxID=1336337 RepID=A0A3N4IVY3_9PEZI|nr:hypothetical protein L873DRAFT_1881967 [Choiromyces venosus 120613-1]